MKKIRLYSIFFISKAHLAVFAAVDEERERVGDYFAIAAHVVGDDARSGQHVARERYGERLRSRPVRHRQLVRVHNVTSGNDLHT